MCHKAGMSAWLQTKATTSSLLMSLEFIRTLAREAMGQPPGTQRVREERSRFLWSTFAQDAGDSRAVFMLVAETLLLSPSVPSLTGNQVEKSRQLHSL